MSKEAMKLALEALKELVAQTEGRFFCMKHDHVALQNARYAIARAREALAEQPAQQAPVAWMFQHEETGRTMCVDAQQVEWGFEKGNPRLKKIAPLYTSPPAQRTWEKWFKWWRTSKVADSTEAEIDFADFMLIVRAVEAEYGIKEKNT